MKNKPLKKSLALFLSLLMVMTSLVYAVPGLAINYADVADDNVSQVTGYVTIDPVIYVHGTHATPEYGYMTYGNNIADGTYAGEFHTNVSVSGKELSSITCVDTGANLSISSLYVWDSKTNSFSDKNVLTGNLGGGYGSNTMDTKDSTATLKFTFGDGTYELRTLYVKTNPVAKHALSYAYRYTNVGSKNRRYVAYEVMALGSYGYNDGGDQNTRKSYVTGGANTSDISNKGSGAINYPHLYAPYSEKYNARDMSLPDLLTDANTLKIAGYYAMAKGNGKYPEWNVLPNGNANYYLDLSDPDSSVGVINNGNDNYSIKMFVGSIYVQNDDGGDRGKPVTADKTGDYQSPCLVSNPNSMTCVSDSSITGTVKSNDAVGYSGYSTISFNAKTAGDYTGRYYTSYKHATDPYVIANVLMNYSIHVVDKSALRNVFDSYVGEKLEAKNYTKASWTAYSHALSEADYYLNNYEASTGNEATLKANLETAYNNLVPRTYDFNYENLFSFSEWAKTDCRKGNNRGTVTVDEQAGTITLDGSGDFYTLYGGSSSYYQVPVTAGTEYTLSYDVTSTDATKQAYVFFYDDNGADVTGAISNGTAVTNPFIGNYNGDDITFTVPAGCTKIGVRFGITGTSKATFSNIAIYSTARAEEVGLEKWTNRQYRKVFSYGDTLTSTIVDYVPTREGYTFQKWYLDFGGAKHDLSEFYGTYTFNASWTLYSDWKINQYTVKFVNKDGTTVSETKYDYGTKASAIAVPTTNSAMTKDETNHYTYSWPAVSDLGASDVTYKEVATATAHSWNAGVIDPDSTCTSEGTKTYTCTVCGQEKTESVGKKAHSLTKTEANPATCTTDGNKAYWTCSVCGKLFSDANGTTETTVAAMTIKAFGHNMTKTDYKAATCTADGNNAYYTCAICNKVFKDADGKTATTVEAETIKATGHTMKKTEAKDATCTADGNKAYWTCSVCKNVYSDETGKTATTVEAETIKALGHKFTGAIRNDGNTKDGTHSYKCVNSGCEEYGNATVHSWNAGVINPDSTCTDEGTKTYTCTADACGATYTEAVSAKGHTFTAEKAEEQYLATPATCTAKATYYKSCSVCGVSSKATDKEETFGYGDYKAHDFTNMSVDNKYLKSAATCTSPAVYYYSCKVCHVTSKDHADTTFEHGTPLTHHMTHHKEVPAKCEVAGTVEYYSCSKCGLNFADIDGETKLDSLVIPALEHNFSGEAKNNDDGTHSYKCVNDCGEYGNPTAHSWNKGEETKAPNCTDKGVKTFKCEDCGATYTADIPANGHSMIKTEANPATCEEAGNKAYWTCSNCNKVFEDEEGKTATTVAAMTIEANGHVYGDLIAEVPATCEGTGIKAHYTCSVCEKNFGADKKELTDLVISAKGHNFTEETATVDYLKSEATCTELAVYYKSCSTCKKSAEGIDNSKTFTSGETKDHAFGKYESFDDADKHNLICSECNNAYGTADHNWVKNEAESFDPTYDNDGKTVSDCKECGQQKEEKVEKKTDSTAPTASIKWNTTIWNSFLTSITFGNYVNYDVTLEISAEDNESGLASTQYYVSNNALTLEEVKAIADWTTYDSNKKLTVSKNDSDKFVVYAKVTDNSGNITYVSTEGFNVDKTAPVIEVSGNGSNDVYCESATVKVTDTNLKTVTVDNEPVELTEGAYTITTAGEHKIVATDMAGNETEMTITVNAEHTWGDPEVIGAPTCTDKGENKYTCTVCGGTKTEEINALGHDTSKVDAKDATCTEDGNKEYYTCSRCDKLFEDEDAKTETTLENVTIKAAHSWENDFTIDKAATCEEAGSKSIHCSKCDAKQNETTIGALGHNFTNEIVDEKYLASAATCTAKAKYYKSCSVCEKSSKDTDGEVTFEKGEQLPHDFAIEVEGTKTAATCKETGSVTMKCAKCDATTTKTLEIDPNNHQGETEIRDKKTANCHEKGYTGDKYCLACGTKIETGTETEIDKNSHDGETQVRDTVTATCCEAGYTGDTYCLGCNDKIADGQATEKDPSNHESTETYLKDDNAATCTSEGYTGDTYHKCCDALKSKGETIPMIAHTWADQVKDEYLASAATCTAKATYYKSCSVCGAKGTETFETGEKLEHNYTGEVQPTGNGNHVFKCVNGCGEFGGQEDCYGGTAVCGSKANCEKCNAPYGEVKAHNYGDWTPNEKGGHTKTCSDCDAETNGHSVSEPHNWDKGEITTPATCGAEGVKTYTCKDCYATKTEPTGAKDPNNHVGETVIKNAKASTCKTEGYTGDVYCKGCMQKISGGTTIAVDPNNHTWGKWGTDKEATCIEEGVSKRVCKECGIDETQPIEKNPDNHVDVTEGVGRKDPTCTEPGYVGATVCACGHVIEQGTYLEALGHEPGAYEIKVMPTEDGVKGKAVSICTRCGIVLGEKEIAYGDVHFVAFYDYNGVRLIKPRYYIYGDKVVRPANDPVRPDDDKNTYKFIGWNYSENELNCVTKEMAVVAQYEAIEKSYTVTFFDANGNPITVPSSSPILYSDIVKSYTGETPTKAEDSEYTYTFSGWAISCDQSTGEASVYPQFTATAKVNEDEEPNEGIFGWLIRLIRKIIAWFKGE